ncbi:dethiobiotin synthase [Acidihalobacter aeolianus]|uniref:dethiobiotin synthase n=1 Tax=Acidihalobacter aeolianus TaxID=2792603 RepID=UPI000A78DF5B|nr:dethiobiotin synthase [Acidihalobacter aeolianus]
MICNNQGVFVTATDTGTGKTTLAIQLAAALTQRGTRVRARKPVESGCQRSEAGELIPADATALQLAAGGYEPLNQVAPYRLEAAISPARAAAIEGVDLHIEALHRACMKGVEPEDFLLVEGAGGFYSPLASDGLNADLASRLGLPMIILAPDRLGVIGHILLTLEAAKRRGLRVAGVVLNRLPDPDRPAQLDNLAELTALAEDIPFFTAASAADLPTLATGFAAQLTR